MDIEQLRKTAAEARNRHATSASNGDLEKQKEKKRERARYLAEIRHEVDEIWEGCQGGIEFAAKCGQYEADVCKCTGSRDEPSDLDKAIMRRLRKHGFDVRVILREVPSRGWYDEGAWIESYDHIIVASWATPLTEKA
jgi:hypothetical protein